MSDLVRKEVFDSCQTVIVKIGSSVLTRDDDQLDEDRILQLGQQIDRLRSAGREVVIVSSGAVAAGIGVLGLDRKPSSLPELQASAAAGQTLLMQAWRDSLARSGHHVAQMLVTVNDFRNRRRYLNVRNTLRTLFDFGVIPIVNENDSVSIQEIALGDNDQLASMISTLVPSPLLVILSGVPGLLDGPPSDPDSRVIPIVEQPGEDLLQHVADEQSSRGRGGMEAKLGAILNATNTGESVILASGHCDSILDRIARGEDVGTIFLASGLSVPAWKRWIGYTAQPEGELVLDAGAGQAVMKDGRSLLAVGIRTVDGSFDQGACVALRDEHGVSVGRGLANYSAADIRIIAGHQTGKIAELLGRVPYREVIHRDNLVLADIFRDRTTGHSSSEA